MCAMSMKEAMQRRVVAFSLARCGRSAPREAWSPEDAESPLPTLSSKATVKDIRVQRILRRAGITDPTSEASVSLDARSLDVGHGNWQAEKPHMEQGLDSDGPRNAYRSRSRKTAFELLEEIPSLAHTGINKDDFTRAESLRPESAQTGSKVSWKKHLAGFHGKPLAKLRTIGVDNDDHDGEGSTNTAGAGCGVVRFPLLESMSHPNARSRSSPISKSRTFTRKVQAADIGKDIFSTAHPSGSASSSRPMMEVPCIPRQAWQDPESDTALSSAPDVLPPAGHEQARWQARGRGGKFNSSPW